ncbi:MAG: hypothetical protein JOZ43_01930, partial [Acidobacteriales bacterium]|nr:hypothetical protein [Terriglobales bacterium]
TRGIFYYGIGGAGTDGPLVAPGTYTVKLTVDGKTVTAPVKVMRDRNTKGSDQDIAESAALSYKIYQDANESARLINHIEIARKQLEDTKKLLESGALGKPADKSLVDATAKLDGQFLEAENKLVHPTIAEGDIKSFRGPIGLYLKFIWLGAEAGNGAADVSGNADFRPTQPEVEVFEMLDKQLGEVKSAVAELDSKGLAEYNGVMEKAGMGRVVAGRME